MTSLEKRLQDIEARDNFDKNRYGHNDDAIPFLLSVVRRYQEALEKLAPGLKVARFDMFGAEPKDCLYITRETENARQALADVERMAGEEK